MMYEGAFSVTLGIDVEDGNYIGLTGTVEVPVGEHKKVLLLYAFARELHVLGRPATLFLTGCGAVLNWKLIVF
ncbi:hypothetical protein [Paraglaciecola hydrolytica]|uniref:Uncharacterized protein n=1 Tax=Paraglaciecola hydrolytica TaxID=1799789 RepID=A0A136A6T1_9ALTE|nr:hypothetical protein [Paraglaciecola hydrolytica]KXI30927.1 hypothetical protein AX660_00200 [Paraglaciecola hydrolytica]